MLTQGPRQDSNNKLNISSFVTFSDPLYCLIYVSNVMIIVFLLHMMGNWKVGGRGGGVHLCYGLVGGKGVGIIVFLLLCSVFLLLLFVF